MDFDGYKTLRLLGKGGMSEVYEVERIPSGGKYAIKIFAYDKDEPTVRERFVAEGELLTRLNHPRVVRVFETGVEKESGRPYFVMDLVLDGEGRTRSLGDVGDGEADEEMIGRWYDDIREGLEYIHGKGIIHRDLKLQNVMIGADNRAVITDFGISKVTKPGEEQESVIDPVQTIIRLQHGKCPLMGSVGYMSPELEMGLPASAQSDYFALGVIVYKLLTGVWCDARTDLAGTLQTFDPVWSRIIPKLLHANPQGRECLSYAEEKAADQAKREFELEDRWLVAKQRSHFARHLARYVGALTILLAAAIGWGAREYLHQKDEIAAMKQFLKTGGVFSPSFDDLFKIPSEAKSQEQYDDEGNVTMYSRAQFEEARVDALVITSRMLSGLAKGEISYESAIAEFERIRDQLDENSEVTPFDNLNIGRGIYMQFGETEPLRMLFERAVEKLHSAAEE